MSQRRVSFITPDDIERWALAASTGIIESGIGSRLFREFLNIHYPNRTPDVLFYLLCFEVSETIRRRPRDLDLHLNNLVEVLPHGGWENRILLTCDMFHGHRLQTEIKIIMEKLQEEIWELIGMEPEFIAFRDYIHQSAMNNMH